MVKEFKCLKCGIVNQIDIDRTDGIPCRVCRGATIPVFSPKININDNVNRPSHYTTGNIEVIEYIKDNLTADMYEGYCIGNVIKYVSRYRNKGKAEDLKKAEVYLKWAIKTLEERVHTK